MSIWHGFGRIVFNRMMLEEFLIPNQEKYLFFSQVFDYII